MNRSRIALAVATAALCAGVGCTPEDNVIDPFPVQIDTERDAVLAFAAIGADGAPLPAVIDTLSPLTVVDTAAPGTNPERRRVDLRLIESNGGTPGVARVRLPDSDAFLLHPCEEALGDAACTIGLEGNQTEVRAIVGADILSRGAVRFNFPDSAVQFFPDIAGTDRERSRSCEVVLIKPFGGGGTLAVGNAVVPFPAVRPVVGACVDTADAPETVDRVRGVGTQFLVSTGLGTTLLSESAYRRIATATGAPEFELLPETNVYLPGGPLEVRIGILEKIALNGETSSSGDSNNRGPCEELYANRVLTDDLCNAPVNPVTPCPCNDGDTFCSASGAIVLRTPIEVAIIDDEEPLLQALRNEMRPLHPEIDGILGGDALSAVIIDFDYPNQRILATCPDPAACEARPTILRSADREAISSCVPDRCSVIDCTLPP